MVRDNTFRAAMRQLKYILPRNKANARRLKSEIEKPQGGQQMIKGLNKRVIVVKSPDGELFEEAIFIIREDVLRLRRDTDVLAEAQRVAGDYLKRNLQHRNPIIAKLTPRFYLAAGAAATGIAWLAVSIAGV